MDADEATVGGARVALRLLAALLCLGAGCAWASGKGTAPTGDAYWYDGQHRRELWEQPGLIASIGPGGDDMAALYPGASRLDRSTGQVRLWRLPAMDARQLTGSANAAARLSPVFADLPRGGRLRALPGGIIVQFAAHWDAARIRDWLRPKNLAPGAPLPYLDNAWHIATPSGMPALQTANAIYESGEVRAAFPDWWEEISLR